MRIAVIGAGLIGVTTAYFLARRGAVVTVFEKGDAVACGASFANGGMLTPSMAEPWNAPGVWLKLLLWLGREDAPLLLRLGSVSSLLGWGVKFLAQSSPSRYRANMLHNLKLGLLSLDVLRDLRTDLQLCYHQRTCGTLKIFRTSETFESACRWNEHLKEHGLHAIQMSAREVVSFEPALADVETKLTGGIHYPDDESGDACLFVEALAAKAREAGVAFRFQTTVDRLEANGTRLSALIANNERIAADAVVVAAGSWSPLLLQTIGLDVPVRPAKGYSVTVPIGDGWLSPQLPVVDDALHAAVTPLHDSLRIAGTAEFCGYDVSKSPARIENLFKLLEEIYPAFQGRFSRGEAKTWAGLRPLSADGVPFIGRFRYENLFLNTGHGPLGWTLATGSGQLLADLITGTSSQLDPVPYAAERMQ